MNRPWFEDILQVALKQLPELHIRILADEVVRLRDGLAGLIDLLRKRYPRLLERGNQLYDAVLADAIGQAENGGLLGHGATEIDRLRARVVEMERKEAEARAALVARDAADALDAVSSKPTAPDVVPVPREEWEDAKREIAAWRNATKADERTKALHIGEYHLSLDVVDDDGEESPWNVPVTWTVIKEIMEAIRADKNKLYAVRSGEGGKEATHG